MKIQQQTGLVSTIIQAPFDDSERDRIRRDRVLDSAIASSASAPRFRADNFDETIVVFDDCRQALKFLTQVSRIAAETQNQSGERFSTHSSLCEGNYFVHAEQIYGDAVNYATHLSMISRENEVLACGIDEEALRGFLDCNPDLICNTRESVGNCFSISILDRESTNGRYDELTLQLDYRDQVSEFDVQRTQIIDIGRSSECSIYIDSDHISRHHATIKLLYDQIHIEDHSSNGTYLYFDDREVFLSNDKMKIGKNGVICCGLDSRASRKRGSAIAYKLADKATTTLSAA